jgi:16S rRNA (guanine527-N7)-methyltransferase
LPRGSPALTAIRAAHPLLAELPEETLGRLEIYANLLEKWQKTLNLVGQSTLADLWVRHFADSLQVAAAVPEARRWLDFGSGAGFPGLVTAIKVAGEADARVHLIESDRGKCAFLQTVIRETSAPAIIHCGRLEAILPEFNEPIDAISARALAPLEALLRFGEKFIEKGAVGVFSKGKQFETELTDSLTAGKYFITTMESRTCSTARLVVVKRGNRP